MRRQTPFSDIVAHLTPFFVTRQIICGAGRVGLGQDGSQPGFQISQRADFFEVEVGLETTLKRPIINTRDEPHADADKYRRLHVIIGDANLSEISTYLKAGTTSLVLAMIESKALTGDLGIADPVAELKAVSHDPGLTHLIRLRDGRRLTALDLQWAHLERARSFVDSQGADAMTEDVLNRWENVLDRLGRDPMLCASDLDWVAKLRLLEGYRERESLGWASPKLQLVDLQYSDVRPEKGLYHRLVARGAMQRMLDDDEVNLGHDRATGRYPGLLPRPLPRQVRRRGGRRELGLRHLRCRPGVAGPRAHDGAGAGHQGPRRAAVRPVPQREGPAGGAHRRLSGRRSGGFMHVCLSL